MNIHRQPRQVRQLSTALAICFTLLLIAAPLAAFAEGGKGEGRHGKRGMRHHHDPEARLAHLSEELDLSAEQQDALRPILEQQAASFREIRSRKQSGESRDELRDQVRALRDENSRQVEAILDGEQLAAYQEIRAQREERFKRKREKRERRGDKQQGSEPEDDPA